MTYTIFIAINLTNTMKNKVIATMVFMVVLSAYAQEEIEDQLWTSNCPDGHAPISIMGDHTHKKGEFMFSYRYMNMQMNDLKRRSDYVSNESVLLSNGGEYMVTPTRMPMDMHMIGGMYAASDKLTLAAMIGYMSMEMDHITAAGGNFTTNSSSVTDLKVSGIYKFF